MEVGKGTGGLPHPAIIIRDNKKAEDSVKPRTTFLPVLDPSDFPPVRSASVDTQERCHVFRADWVGWWVWEGSWPA